MDTYLRCWQACSTTPSSSASGDCTKAAGRSLQEAAVLILAQQSLMTLSVCRRSYVLVDSTQLLHEELGLQ